MEVWFYHLQRQPLAAALPRLLERSAGRGWRTVVQCADEAGLKALDDALWSYAPESFLPHAAENDPRAASQPVVLTTGGDNPNGAALRILTGGVELPAAAAVYERLIVIFDGNNPGELAKAREQWAKARAGDLAPTYWRQSEEGAWTRGP